MLKALSNPFKIFVPAVLLIALSASPLKAERLTSVLIFPVRVTGISLPNSKNVEIRNYLATRLTIEGVYMVMPESQIQKDLGAAKLESYKECYDDACRIELGGALFADKSLSVDVVAEKNRCRVTATIYNIKQEVTEMAADVVVGCAYEDIKGAMVAVAAQLSGKNPSADRSIPALQSGGGASESQLTRPGGITGVTETGTVKAGMTVDLGDKIVNQITDQKGFLTVKTRGVGETGDARAMIMLNGKEFRPSPFTTELMVGDYVVAARVDDYYHTATQKIHMGTDGKTVELELQPTFGSLVIETDPADADVLINGNVVGKTATGKPYTDNRRKAGTYTVEARKQLYMTAKRTVTISEGKETKEKFRLDPDFGNLKFTSKPSGASVFLDGQDVGKTPLNLNNLPSGSHSIRVSLDYYIPETAEEILGDGKTITKHFDLRTDFGGIRVTSEPAGAAITIDNASTGKVTPALFSPMRPGVHVITLEMDGYGKSVQTVNVENGIDAMPPVPKLEPKFGMLSVIIEKEDGTPCEGDVRVDSQVVGRSPWKGQVLAKSHNVGGECPEGMGSKSVNVPHNGSESATIEVGDRGYVSVRTLTPDGKECIGKLAVNGTIIGTTPWSDWLKAGTYQIAGTCGEQSGSGSVVLARGDHKSLDLNMNSNGIQWIQIPGGSFQMGSTVVEDDETPVHLVTVQTFEIAKTEVTVAQYCKCVEAGACSKTSSSCSWGSDKDDHPITSVDWDQANTYAKWVGGRLPTEAEWEYAARSGGKKRTYPWGNETATCQNTVMWEGGDDGCRRSSTWPVCSKTAGNTEQGLCDMAGNVWEWVQDWYHDSYNGAPSNGSAWESPSGSKRVVRGGSGGSYASLVRAANRDARTPGNRSSNLGFRPARSVR